MSNPTDYLAGESFERKLPISFTFSFDRASTQLFRGRKRKLRTNVTLLAVLESLQCKNSLVRANPSYHSRICVRRVGSRSTWINYSTRGFNDEGWNRARVETVSSPTTISRKPPSLDRRWIYNYDETLPRLSPRLKCCPITKLRSRSRSRSNFKFTNY